MDSRNQGGYSSSAGQAGGGYSSSQSHAGGGGYSSSQTPANGGGYQSSSGNQRITHSTQTSSGFFNVHNHSAPYSSHQHSSQPDVFCCKIL